MTDPNPEIRTDEQPETVTPQPAGEPTVPPTTEPPVTPPAESPIDYEKKFAESTREAQILAAQLEAERARTRKELTNEPTDSDLQAAFPEWDVMTDTERKLARRTFATERLTTSLLTEREQEKVDRRWNTDLELTIASNPSLLGKEQAFKDFAKKPTHRGAPLETLVSAFLFESSSKPSSNPAPTSEPGLLPGNGGPREAEKPKSLSGAELKQLRETDAKAYTEYIRTHDIAID